MSYELMNYGFDSCPVQMGTVQTEVSLAEMSALADQANAGGFCYNPQLRYGALMIGLYPPTCQSPADMSWPLYLKTAALPQFMQAQTETNWCWAASGASVGNLFYGTAAYTQCAIANTCQAKNSCCADPAACNQYGFLDQALQAARAYDGHAAGACGLDVVQLRIDQGQPVGNRLAWNGGGAHFVMGAGYNNDGNTIVVQDPWYGTSTVDFASYPAAYHGGATWTDTYFTKKS